MRRAVSLVFVSLILVSLFLVSLLAAGAATLEGPEISEEVRAAVRARVETGQNQGVVVGVVEAGGTSFYSYGRRSEAVAGSPDEHTIFEIGSITKVFTALLLADMAARGEVSLDDPIAKYLPEGLEVPSGKGSPITLRHLASHASGLPRLPENLPATDPENPYAGYTAEMLYRFLAEYELPREPGAEYEYSNVGMGLLGHLLARKAGTTYEELVAQRITGPLGMEETAIALSPELRQRLVPGHSGTKQVSAWDWPTLAGAGALHSSAHDLLRFLAANLGLRETPLFSTMQSMHQPITDAPEPSLQIGLSWHLTRRGDRRTVWHSGRTGGYASFAGFDPETRRGVVVLTNSSSPIDDVGILALGIALPPVVEVKPEVLDRYVGEYRLNPELSVTVTRSGQQLMVQATGQDPLAVFPESETKFSFRVVDLSISFQVDDQGKVESLTLHQQGLPDQVAKKVR